MKYFTFSWWAGDDSEEEAKPKDYSAYIGRILPDLPSDLQRFVRSCSLHDASLTRLRLSVAERSLTLELVGGCHDDSLPNSYARRFRLTYLGVSEFVSTANPNRGLGGPPGYGDLGYDEIEIVGPGLYEHRMIFSTSIEFQIRFTGFSLWYEDFEFHRDA
jgi:hypothetical protein